MKMLSPASALALACLAASTIAVPANAQVPANTGARAPAGYLPGGAQFCSTDGGATWIACPPNAGSPPSPAQADPGVDAAKATAVQGVTNGKPVAISSAAIGAPAATAPTSAQQIGGVGPAGKLRVLATDTLGRLIALPLGTPATVAPITLAANTITLLSDVAPTRIGMSVQLETASTAPVYLCSYGQSTTCSASVHDAFIPAGAAIGTEYFFPFPTSAGYYAVSSAAVTITPHSVTAQ